MLKIDILKPPSRRFVAEIQACGGNLRDVFYYFEYCLTSLGYGVKATVRLRV